MTGVIVLLVVLVAAAVAAVLASRRRRIDELAQHLAEANRALAAVRTAELEASAGRTRAESDAAAASEREQRARREAAEVARRLAEAQAAAGAGEARVAELDAQLAEARARLAELEAVVARATEARLAAEAAAEAARAAGPAGDGGLLWSLELGRTARTWAEAVAPGPGLDPPVVPGPVLDDAAEELRAAVEVEVDAARETTGALAELSWQVEAEVPASTALVALRTVQEVLAAVAKTADSARIEVGVDGDELVVAIAAVDGSGASAPVGVPALAERADGAGRYRAGPVRGAPRGT